MRLAEKGGDKKAMEEAHKLNEELKAAIKKSSLHFGNEPPLVRPSILFSKQDLYYYYYYYSLLFIISQCRLVFYITLPQYLIDTVYLSYVHSTKQFLMLPWSAMGIPTIFRR